MRTMLLSAAALSLVLALPTVSAAGDDKKKADKTPAAATMNKAVKPGEKAATDKAEAPASATDTASTASTTSEAKSEAAPADEDKQPEEKPATAPQ